MIGRPSPASAFVQLAKADITMLRSTARTLITRIPIRRRSAWIERFLEVAANHVAQGAPPEGVALITTAILAEQRAVAVFAPKGDAFLRGGHRG